MAIDHHDLAGSLDDCRQGGHQTNRASPINHNGLAGLETCEPGGMPTGGKNIRQECIIVLLFAGVLRQTQAVEIAVWDTEVFRLSAQERTHAGKAISGPGHSRINSEAKRGKTCFAVFAEATTDVKWQAHLVTFFDAADSRTNLDDFTGVLVTENASRFEIGPALVHMQVRTANVGGGDLDDHIVGLLNSGVRNIFDADVAGSVVNDCFHGSHPSANTCVLLDASCELLVPETGARQCPKAIRQHPSRWRCREPTRFDNVSLRWLHPAVANPVAVTLFR